ncbi:MAG TPA: rhombosortase [Burkholderiaceae bacterium]|nr:rhombosortase [Burkholderiaceae bacterium]HRZ00039.1 rhombosortase [Burkholderiaceae bacterium]
MAALASDRPPAARSVRAALVLALGLALLAAAVQWLGWAPAWEYRRAWLGDEPWRALSGHLAHLSWLHWAVNAVALVLVAALLAPWMSAREQAATLAVTGLGVAGSLAVLWPEVAWYRGLSGALHGLFFAGVLLWWARAARAARWLPGLLLAGGLVKLGLEQAWRFEPAPLAWLGAPAVAPAHLAGALVGLACGCLALAWSRR